MARELGKSIAAITDEIHFRSRTLLTKHS
jgi:hypothetical protein